MMRDIVLQPGVAYLHTHGIRRIRHILPRLEAGLAVDVDAHHLRPTVALGHHEGYKCRACSHIKDAGAAPCPCAEQHAVGAHLHGATLLVDGETAETEKSV